LYKKLLYLPLLVTYLFSATQYNDIKFEGLSQISQTIAIETSKFNKNTAYSEQQINNTIKSFYKFGYFNNIKVTTKNDILTFTFEEKPFISALKMTGYKARDEDLDTLYRTMKIKKGNMYSPSKVAKAKERLLIALEQEGYVNSVVEVEVENLSKSSIAIKFLVNKGEHIIIKDVNYAGAKELDGSDFSATTVNKAQDCCFTWFYGRSNGEIKFDQLEYDSMRIREKYLAEGFLDAVVKTPFAKVDFNTNTAQLDIAITEGAQYKVGNTVIYLDESIVNPKDIYPELRLKKERIFDIDKLRKDVAYIKTQVADKGYAFVDIKYDIRKDAEKNTADLIYTVVPGEKVYINDVIISGNSRTLDRVIRRNIYLAPEDLFSLTDFKDSQNALGRTGFFENVKIEKKRIAKDKMNLIVSVQEAPTGNLTFGGGYGSYDGMMINASVNDKNIFGSGLDIGLSLDWSKKSTSFTTSIKNPAINDSIYSGSVSAFKTTSDITHTNYELTTDSTGITIGVGRKLSRHSSIGATYALTQTKEKYDDNVTVGINYVTSSITPYISFNNTDSYQLPRNGIVAGTSLEIAGLGGDSKYIKSSTYFKYFKGLDDYLDYDAIIRYKAKINVLRDQGFVAQGNSFYLGGSSTVRGYQSHAFGPDLTTDEPYKNLFATSVELNFPLFEAAQMRWGLFYDYGMIGESSFSEIKRSGAGALIEWNSPVGPLQFIFSEALDAKPGDKTSSFEFSLGSKF